MHHMPRTHKKLPKQAPQVLISTRVSAEEAKEFHRVAAADHRKLSDVIRMLLADWKAKKEAA